MNFICTITVERGIRVGEQVGRMERIRNGYKISSLNLMGKTPISNAHRKLLPWGQRS
jgi:hypothetical protein